MPTQPSRAASLTPEQQEESHNQELREVCKRLVASPDFGVFYAAVRAKADAARHNLPTRIITPDDVALYNELIGFIRGLEVMFDMVRFYTKEA